MGLNRDSGLFALAGVVPQPPELSYDTGDSLVLKAPLPVAVCWGRIPLPPLAGPDWFMSAGSSAAV